MHSMELWSSLPTPLSPPILLSCASTRTHDLVAMSCAVATRSEGDNGGGEKPTTCWAFSSVRAFRLIETSPQTPITNEPSVWTCSFCSQSFSSRQSTTGKSTLVQKSGALCGTHTQHTETQERLDMVFLSGLE